MQSTNLESGANGCGNGKEMKGRLKPHPGQLLKCPRCESLNTKFCYYNNYNLSQPRHFCKNCRRYWTKGGALRNVPVGGGCRKNKRSTKHQRNANGDQHQQRNLMGASCNKTPPTSDKAAAAAATAAALSTDATGASSTSSLVNIQEGSDRSSIGFDPECNKRSINGTSNVISGLFCGISHSDRSLDFHLKEETELLNASGPSLSSILAETVNGPHFPLGEPVIGSTNWPANLLDSSCRNVSDHMQWKEQQSLTSLMMEGKAFLDGSIQPPPLLEDLSLTGEASSRVLMGKSPTVGLWPNLQDSEGGNNYHPFDFQTNNNSEALFEMQSDMGCGWAGGSWSDLAIYGPGSSLP